MKNRLTICLLLLTNITATFAHDGPDPISHWDFSSKNIKGSALMARLGPDGQFSHPPQLYKDEAGEMAIFDGRAMECVIAGNFLTLKDTLPTKDFTVSAWVSITKPEEWGSIIGVVQDNAEFEKGWLVGYDQNNFYFGLSTKGADDGDGAMTYLKGQTKYELGMIYHVVAVYDGETMQLYVNGKLDGSSKAQSDEILYPESAPYVIGCYHDENEFHPMHGRIKEIALYDLAAKEKWIREEFEHQSSLTKLAAVDFRTEHKFIVKPYLQYGTRESMTVCWRNSGEFAGIVRWGETANCENESPTGTKAEFQQVKLEGLKPETQYFYMVETKDADENPIASEVSTFQTASNPETPFSFAVISDTQHNPSVSGPIAEMAWAKRPNFMLHAGDLVDKGKMSDDWIDEFFASMHPLISRVPFYPVLGNHEQNAKNYFDYMALPDPEYYYQFSYGNTDFFMIDSNRKVDAESEQYKWLDEALAKSKATWKFVCHHHPPYSSDENDYGDLWKTNKSTRGDTRVRALVPLYDKHNVDIVWNGHIHSYERTWPLKENQATDKNGTIYMITGGGGGGLETPGPFKPFFQNNVQRGHHYLLVAINGGTLELKSYDFEDRLFDTLQIDKTK